jgi:hypothetical protein
MSNTDSRKPEKPQSRPDTVNTDTPFTVAEYRIYRAMMISSMAVSEREAEQRLARSSGKAAVEIHAIVQKVQMALFGNDWNGSPGSEIQHASDWAR